MKKVALYVSLIVVLGTAILSVSGYHMFSIDFWGGHMDLLIEFIALWISSVVIIIKYLK